MKPSRRQSTANQTATGSGRLQRRILLAVGLFLGVVIAVAFYAPGFWRSGKGEKSSPKLTKNTEKQKPNAVATSKPTSKSPYLNTRPGVKYVGMQACIACHEEEHASFMHTGMGRSMAEADLSREPPDATFDHPASGSRYEVRRKDGKMWHREFLLTGGTEEVLLQEHPVKYVTGSGRHSLTYVVEVDGFLVESPITWYTSRSAWGMSPGYDRPNHSGFEREVGEGCLVCHSGQVKAIDKSMHRMQITETTIGCEQCHGPGELHVKRQEQKGGPAAGDVDDTIVNPARLTRELSEAVCQQCHLRAQATVLAKGRTLFDFRPGLRLSDYRQDYELDIPNKEMTVVGHVEQMHQSRCYQESKTFSCLTCHGPHGEPEDAKKLAAHYIKVCTSCHEPASCRVSESKRQKESSENDCIACHMPRTDTDIPHLAFTHHRIAIHDVAEKGAGSSMPPQGAGVLRPVLDISHLGENEQQRSLGLAYLEVANKEDDLSCRHHYQQQAMTLLTQVRGAGGVDGSVDAWLARLRFELRLPDVQRYAQAALADPELSGLDLCNALFLMADAQFEQRRYQEALLTLQSLNKLRRSSLQYLLQAQCEKAVGNEAETEQALLAAVGINPRLSNIHQRLAEIYRQRGDEQRAKYHEARAAP